MKNYYSLVADENILHYLASQKISKTAMMLAFLLPSSATWCEKNTSVEERNLITLDKNTICEYIETLHITERIFKNLIRELTNLSILKKYKKDKYYCNPWWAFTGDDRSVLEFRNYCEQMKLFIPWNMRSLDLSIPENRGKLSEELAKKPSSQYVGIYISLDNLKYYKAFISEGKERMNATDIMLLIAMAHRCSYIYPHSPISNVIILNGEAKSRMAKNLCVKERTLRDSFVKLRDLHMIEKLEGVSGKYMINPMIAAKGREYSVSCFQKTVTQLDCEYFGGYAGGDIRRC